MLKIKFYNLKKIFKKINKMQTEPLNYPSVFSSIKKMILFFILYLFVTIVATFIIIFSFNKNIKKVSVPKVVNMEFHSAYKVLNERGLHVDIELKKDNNIPRGIVVFQSIPEHKKVKKGRKIKLVISLGSRGVVNIQAKTRYEVNTYIINFKLPDQYDEAKVKVIISDDKIVDKVIFNEILSSTNNKIRLPVKINGQGIQKIYINDDLFIEKDINQ